MRLQELELDEFRSFRRLRLPIEAAGFRAVGSNASGKSTLLEAIAMLATTRSPRTAAEREIPHWESGAELSLPPYARLRGAFERLDGLHQIEIGLTIDQRGQGALRKQARLDDRAVRAVDAVGQLQTVLFSPEDVSLLSGPPAGRRRYLDVAISQASRSYLRALTQYGRVLEQRNSLLRAFVRDRATPDSTRHRHELSFWDAQLEATATEVLALRIGAITVLCARARHHYERLTGDRSLNVAYASSRLQVPKFNTEFRDWRLPDQETRQMLAAAFANSLDASRAEEFRRGVTVIGPHRDDVAVTASGADLGRFGSRGQQRLAVIALKLGELDLLEQAAGEPPVLLLDDVLSELDSTHRARIIETLDAKHAQIFVTAADKIDLVGTELDRLPLIITDRGAVQLDHTL
ncbi:MAG: DNA replication/repair protein RecF [Thermomicrobiales bacterium]